MLTASRRSPSSSRSAPLLVPRALLLSGSLLAATALWHGQQRSQAAQPTRAVKHRYRSRQTPQKAPLKLAFVTNNASDFWTITQRGVERAGRDLGLEVQFHKPANGTTEEQSYIAKTLLANGVQGIAIAPKDPENQVSFLNSLASKTNLVTVDSDVPQSKRLCYIGTDNYAAGRMAGQLMKKAAPQGGSVMLFVGTQRASNAQDRERGIRDALRGSRLRIIGLLTDETDRLKAKTNAYTALKKYPKLVGMMGLWSYNGPQILSAVRDADKVGKVKIVCFDEEDDTLYGVKAGGIFATVVQDPYQFGYQSMKLLAQLSRGNRSGIPASRRIIVPTRAIESGNVDAFSQQLRKLRY